MLFRLKRNRLIFTFLSMISLSMFSLFVDANSERIFKDSNEKLLSNQTTQLDTFLNSIYLKEQELFKLAPLNQEHSHDERDETAAQLYARFPEQYKKVENYIYRGMGLSINELKWVLKKGLDPNAGFVTPGTIYFGEEPTIAILYSIFNIAKETFIAGHYGRDPGIPTLVIMKRDPSRFTESGLNFGEARIFHIDDPILSHEFEDILILKPENGELTYHSIKNFIK